MSVRIRKRFGQHFLNDSDVLERICETLALNASDMLLEIGPGTGALTERLEGRCQRFVAVEIDRDLAARLHQRFPELDLRVEDILKTDLQKLFGDERWRVLGNLPYNVSTPLLLKLMAHSSAIADMHLMVQREVALRLAAVPGTKAWGRLTVMTQFYCEVEPLFDVAPESFVPPPAVWSSVLRISPHRKDWGLKHFEHFRDVVRLGFGQRRKRITNALKTLAINWAEVDVDPDKRPDHLDVAEYVAIANAVTKPQ